MDALRLWLLTLTAKTRLNDIKQNWVRSLSISYWQKSQQYKSIYWRRFLKQIRRQASIVTSLICSCTGFDEIRKIRNEILLHRKKIRPVVFLNGFPPELIWIVFSKKLEPRFRSDFFATEKNNIFFRVIGLLRQFVMKMKF